MRNKSPNTRLVKITLTKRADNKWDILREWAENGERALGFLTLGEALDYIEAHETPLDETLGPQSEGEEG